MTDVSYSTDFYISTRSSSHDERARVLKFGPTFATFNRYGDIVQAGLGEEGIFHHGTRHLSRFKMLLGGCEPLLLSSTISADNLLFVADLSNVDLCGQTEIEIARGTIHVARTRYLWGGGCFERFRITNYGLTAQSIPLQFEVGADFVDIFEVRGTPRQRRGIDLPVESGEDWILLRYEGLDGLLRSTCIQCEPKPMRCSESQIGYELHLQPKTEVTIQLQITLECSAQAETKRKSGRTYAKSGIKKSYDEQLSESRLEVSREQSEYFQIRSNNEQFNQWLTRSVADTEMMIRGNPERNYPYAGVPWYSTIFGRDGIITAMELLWLWPEQARGVLEFLAKHQAREIDPNRDAEPGKILHELRHGEMANLDEVPFGCYYGSVDATPLFLMLAAAYFERTGDRQFISELWPHLELALGWIGEYGDRDGDGFVEYERRSSTGLTQQGWKDSSDSVFHADGTLAEGAIALCEVQGYVYAAKTGMAKIARALGRASLAQQLERQAEKLRGDFEEKFWFDDLGMYAIALDGKKRPCKVRTSNPGHCLYTGIADPERARVLAQNLMGPDFYSGWGIRTVGAQEVRYNPISYHNGSVWPHDNAIIASGLARYGMKDLTKRVLGGLLDLSVAVELHRLPELFCGLHRRSAEGPTLYPVACSPQAWAAGAVFMVMQAALGIQVNDLERRITLDRPDFLERVPRLWISNLRVEKETVDLFFERRGDRTEVVVTHTGKGVEVVLDGSHPRVADSRVMMAGDRAAST